MPRSSGVAVRLARSAAALHAGAAGGARCSCADAPAQARSPPFVPSSTLIARSRPSVRGDASFRSTAICPSIRSTGRSSPGNCLVGIRDQPDANTRARCPARRVKPGRSTALIVAIDTFPIRSTTAQRAFTLVIEPECAEPSITSGAPPPATAGSSYAFTGERDRYVRRRSCRSPACRPVFPSMPRRV